MKSFGLTDKGRVRQDNQDSFIIESCTAKDSLIVALCDGMGGAKAGGLASRLSNRAFVSYIYAKLTSRTKRPIDYKTMLQSACAEANSVSYEYSQFDEAYKGMGTTIVGGVINGSGNGYIINVGDSRAYHITPEGITRVTKDHSLVESMVDRGDITAEEARHHPNRNLITRALGPDISAACDGFICPMEVGDYLLLCTDGLIETVSDQEMLFEIVHGDDPGTCLDRLLAIAKHHGAPDNVTAVLARKL